MPRSPLAALALLLAALATPAAAQIVHHTWYGSQAGGWTGFAVGSIGTASGDRRLLIGTPWQDHFTGVITFPSAGAVRCYAGTNLAGPPLFTAYGAQQDELGRSIANVGDVNGDHTDDFAVGAPYGSASPTLFEEGYVKVYSGLDGSLFYTFDSPQDHALFGFSVGGVGDVNGDGWPDIGVGSPDYDMTSLGQQDNGRVSVYSGATGLLLQAYSGSENSELGWSVCGVGDVNGDGRDDFAAGAYSDETMGLQAGRVVVITGGTATIWKNLYGNSTTDDFGWDIAGGGDCNGDGQPDLIVGVPGEAGDRGMVEVFLGPSFNTMYKQWVSAIVNDRMGVSVDFAGDVDKDGYDDIVMGANEVNGVVVGPGRVYGRSGKTGATIIPAQLGAADGDAFGDCVAGVGDADGDGWDDVLVGEPFGDALATDAGGARLIGWQVVQPDAGGGGVGSAQLSVYGAALASGYVATLELSGAPPLAPAWLLASPLEQPLPFKGGTLIPNVAFALTLALPVNAQGGATLTVPGGGGPFTAWVQVLVKDPAQPKGWQLTHGVELDFLP
jgi:FG-GAP repeat